MTANDISGRVPRWLDQVVREKSCLIQSFLRTQPSKIDQFHICVSWWRPKVCFLVVSLCFNLDEKMKVCYRHCMFILFDLNKFKVRFNFKSLKQLKEHLSRFKLLPQPSRPTLVQPQAYPQKNLEGYLNKTWTKNFPGSLFFWLLLCKANNLT